MLGYNSKDKYNMNNHIERKLASDIITKIIDYGYKLETHGYSVSYFVDTNNSYRDWYNYVNKVLEFSGNQFCLNVRNEFIHREKVLNVYCYDVNATSKDTHRMFLSDLDFLKQQKIVILTGSDTDEVK